MEQAVHHAFQRDGAPAPSKFLFYSGVALALMPTHEAL